MKDKHKQAFMDIAKRFAQCSTANKMKVGAICVHENENQIISIGYNGTPEGWDNQCEDEHNNTFPYVIHAEANMLSKICRSNLSSKNSIVFITHGPCLECSKLIYSAGVKQVYYETEYRKTDGIEFLKRCGVNVEQINNIN